jgi:hypothetical protein
VPSTVKLPHVLQISHFPLNDEVTRRIRATEAGEVQGNNLYVFRPLRQWREEPGEPRLIFAGLWGGPPAFAMAES